MSNPLSALAWGTVAILLASLSAVAEVTLQVTDGVLLRSESAFQVRGFHIPDAAQRGTTVADMAPPMARIADVGGNTLCVDLFGFDATGRSLDATAVAAITTYAERANDQRMVLMLRVLAGLEDDVVRARAVRTAARAFKNETRILYWIDGENSVELTDKFKRAAPDAVVVSPGGGDIVVLRALEQERYEKTAYLARGVLPNNPTDHFLLESNDDNYAAVETALTTDVERNAGFPDPIVVADRERKEGFQALFNGRDLSNWWLFGDNPNGFHVTECGEIEWVEPGAEALMSSKRYGDFILRLEYKLLPGYNSGIFLRAPRGARQSRIGMEFQLQGDHGLTPPTDDCTGAIYKVVPPLVVASKPGAQWNQLEIALNGPRMRATLNGVLVQDINLDDYDELKYRLRRGFIGLQDHQNYVAFRNVRIKELNP